MSAPAASLAPAAITVRGLTKRFGVVRALEDVTFEVPRGGTVVLWGPNGAGKTTVLRCLLGIVPFDGSVEIMGHDVREEGKAARACVGYVPQEIRLHGDQTVRETLAFYAALRRAPRERIGALLAEWQLEAASRQPVRALSGGMKQRLALALALLADPPVFLLDEPSSSLDVRARRDLILLLERLSGEGRTLVLSSHRTSDLWRLADRVIALRAGRLVLDAAPEDASRELPDSAVIWITVPTSRTREAAELLARQGMMVEHNGAQLWVMGTAGRRIEPIVRLQEAGIPVLDFDVESGG